MLPAVTVVVLALTVRFLASSVHASTHLVSVVSTKALQLRQAVAIAAIAQFTGALFGSAITLTLVHHLLPPHILAPPVLLSALLTCLTWLLLVPRIGLPASSGHALVGALCGSALSRAGTEPFIGTWSHVPDNGTWIDASGLLPKVLVPMLAAPALGWLTAALLVALLALFFTGLKVQWVSPIFRRFQVLSFSCQCLLQGSQDAQKTLAILLLAAAAAGASLPAPADTASVLPAWMRLACGLAMAGGTLVGSWKLTRITHRKITPLHPVQGFSSDCAASAVLLATTTLGMPVSTPQIATSTVLGSRALRGGGRPLRVTLARLALAWIFTLPLTALMGYLLHPLLRWLD